MVGQMSILGMTLALVSMHTMQVTLVAQDRQRAESKVEAPSGSLTTVAERGTIHLAWRNTRGTDLPASDVYRAAAGDRMDDEEILTRLRQVPTPASAGIAPKLLVFFSHPQLGPGASGELAFLDTEGRELQCFQGTFGPNIRYASRANPGIMTFVSKIQAAPMWPDNGTVPDRGKLRVRYAAGELETIAGFKADESPGSMFPADVEFGKAVALVGVGEDIEGEAFVSIHIQSEAAQKFVYFVIGFDKELREISPSGWVRINEPSASPYVMTFQFRQPLSQMSVFRLRRLEIREEEYDVWFRPERKP